MTAYPKNPEARTESEALEYSVSGRAGKFLEPAFRPIGFDWRTVTAVFGAFAAKEVFVAQMGIVHSVDAADEESESLREKLRASYNPLQAFSMMLWALLSLPCVATVAVARRETGSWKWVLFMVVSMTMIAYLTCLVVYQAGSALGIGTGMLTGV
jgi:ferrous iron transport protein B